MSQVAYVFPFVTVETKSTGKISHANALRVHPAFSVLHPTGSLPWPILKDEMNPKRV